MSPPFLARALIAATTPPDDYESVAGDLFEEYALRLASSERAAADRWYWSQVLRSIPSFLSYSRTPRTFRANLSTASTVFVVLFAMLFFKDLIDRVIDLVDPGAAGFPAWLYFALNWLDAVLFGGILAARARREGTRLALIASLTLVTAFALPIVLGISPALPPRAWLLLPGVIPAMTIGAALYQGLRRREGRSN